MLYEMNAISRNILITMIDELYSVRFNRSVFDCDFIIDTRFNHSFEKKYNKIRKVMVENDLARRYSLNGSLPSIYFLSGYRFECFFLLFAFFVFFLIIHFDLRLDFQLFNRVRRIYDYDINGFRDVSQGTDAIFDLYIFFNIGLYVYLFHKIEKKVSEISKLIDELRYCLLDNKQRLD